MESKDLRTILDENYKCDPSSLKKVFEIIPRAEIEEKILRDKDDLFLLEAGKHLSYNSLALIINLNLTPSIAHKFNKDSKILKTFIHNICSKKINGLERPQIKKVLTALMWINEAEVINAVVDTNNKVLLRLLLELVKLERSSEMFIQRGSKFFLFLYK